MIGADHAVPVLFWLSIEVFLRWHRDHSNAFCRLDQFRRFNSSGDLGSSRDKSQLWVRDIGSVDDVSSFGDL